MRKFHKVGIKVLGDAVLNHRCAHFKNQNGVWNLFGGRLNWDDRAVVADDPHFQVYFSFFGVVLNRTLNVIATTTKWQNLSYRMWFLLNICSAVLLFSANVLREMWCL